MPKHSYADIFSEKGSDAWWYMSTEELLPEKYRNMASNYQKGTDTMDVWFDSGNYFKACHSSFIFSSLAVPVIICCVLGIRLLLGCSIVKKRGARVSGKCVSGRF
jgi:hypothetical protein